MYRSDRLALDQAIVQLPHGYRIVFVLHDVEGVEHSENSIAVGLLDRDFQVSATQSSDADACSLEVTALSRKLTAKP